MRGFFHIRVLQLYVKEIDDWMRTAKNRGGRAINIAAMKPRAGLTGGQVSFGSAAQRSIAKAAASRLYYLLQRGVKVVYYARYNGAIFAMRFDFSSGRVVCEEFPSNSSRGKTADNTNFLPEYLSVI